jgi:hypothetical protein
VGGANLSEMKASTLWGQISENNDFNKIEDQDVKEFLEYLKDELLKENSELRNRLEETLEEIEQLKCGSMDTNEKEAKIALLNLKIEKMEKMKNNSHFEVEFARISIDNANLKAKQVYYFNVMRELMKAVKKQKNQLKNSLAFLSEEDLAETESIIKEFKIKY